MVLLARTAKLGSRAYDARHARVRLPVMQLILAVRETVVIKPSRLNIVAQRPIQFHPPFPASLALIHTFVSRVGSDQAAGKRAGEVHYEKKRGRTTSTLHTHRQASLMVWRYTTLVPPLRLCVGPARERQASALVREGARATSQKKEKERHPTSVIDFVHV